MATTNSSQDDALAFQVSAIAEQNDAQNAADEALDEDPLNNPNQPHAKASAIDSHERYMERPRVKITNARYSDPDQMPHKINGRRITPPTRHRDRALLNTSNKFTQK